MQDTKPAWLSWHYVVLWIIVLISLLMNVLLFAGLIAFRSRAQQEVASVAATLNDVDIASSFEVPVKVDEQLPISLTVPFSDTFHVPIRAIVPVSTSVVFTDTIAVPINEIMRVDTIVNVPFNNPLGGQSSIPLPIVTDIPINLDISVPISTNVPIRMEIPVNLDIDVPVQTVFPINEDIQVLMDFPVTIPLDDLGFNVLLDQVRDALNLLASALGVEIDTP